MTTQDSHISVIDPISPAIERVKTILFRPFDLGRWLVIGLCAWLAHLGQGGGGGGGPNFNFPRHRESHQYVSDVEAAKDFILGNLYWLAPLVLAVVAVSIVLWLVFIWLSSRGKFMFLHCVAQNKAEVKIPWTKFRSHANSLFLFRIVLFFVGLVVIGLPIILAVLSIVLMVGTAGIVGLVLGISALIAGILAAVIVLALIQKFTTDFVVPIMFLRTASCTAAWREFLTLLSANKARFAIYILFQIVIAIAVGAVVAATVCCTCCCACCILAIPFIGTVVLLPIHVFDRAYSLYYLRQFSPVFDVFGSQTQTVLTV